MTYSILHGTRSLQVFLEVIAGLALLAGWIAPAMGARLFGAIERGFDRLARKRWQAIAAATLFPMIVRALLLPVFPQPLPRVHDEFSYLLLGDTLAHGRLANPTPPSWRHFETEYELVRPTYASQYEPGQGVALAAGQIIGGDPWWGVWLSIGGMCGALCWALGCILPARWALFGSLIAALQFGIYGFWMNSYFGGAVPAIGGALVFGALARRRRLSSSASVSPAVVCAVGLVIVLGSRPLEGILWLGIVTWMELMRKPFRRPLRSLIPSAALFLLILGTGMGALAYYNARVTGNVADPPYARYRREYGTPQSYWWQQPVIITHFDHAEMEANYEDQLRYWERRYSPARLWDSTWRRARDFWRFFIGPFLTPALLFLAVAARKARLRPWLWVSGVFILDHVTYHAWYPQQSASETVLIVLLLVEGWRHLRAWRRRAGVGLAFSRQLIAGFALAIVLVGAGPLFEPVLPHSWNGVRNIWAGLSPAPASRDLAREWLERVPGKHLVFVHYGAKHEWYDEWVFNGADIPSSRIVFARMYTPESDRALARSMSDRHVWIADVGSTFRLAPIPPAELATFTEAGR